MSRNARNRALLNDALTALCALYPDGELVAASFPAQFIEVVTKDVIKSLRDRLAEIDACVDEAEDPTP